MRHDSGFALLSFDFLVYTTWYYNNSDFIVAMVAIEMVVSHSTIQHSTESREIFRTG